MKRLILTSVLVCSMLGSLSIQTANAKTRSFAESKRERVYFGDIEYGQFRIALFGERRTGKIEVIQLYDNIQQKSLPATVTNGFISSGLATLKITYSDNGTPTTLNIYEQPLLDFN
ncbi:hypothetical protein HDE69_002437 [Pedobacter cryoconitis]|uniref:Uncharacterized protein n=1 Tax=Pedobacter cryoconitis TaxID=188932 RepID=A0A7W8YT90_9SPHI|nr:hypothetical protein [Pedobacter cryoconitis]MBB5621376.1 hypothetical protein [Pedobacter cryoconitis]MBB5649123.1 hypothetical protein [Pedobacter cryoconitis]